MNRFRARLLTVMLATFAPVTLTASSRANPPCPSDLDGDGSVGGGDLALVLLDWGDCPVDPPTIVSISPTYGPTTGGTTITISGIALTGTASVTVRGNTASSVVVVNDTTVTAVTPPGALGAANVQVTTPGGTATISNAFTYGNAPPPPAWCTVLEQSPNPSIVFDSELRTAIIATGLPWRVRDSGTGIEMVLVPAGSFSMGCSPSNSYPCNADESPAHQVTLTRNFYLGRFEVTQAQWTAKMGSNPSNNSGDTNRPVEMVSANEMRLFCEASNLRLPSEAEWEYAYRARTTSAFHGWVANPTGTSDDSQLSAIAWFVNNSANQTHPVGTRAANALGLHDMAGNVWEMVSDWYGAYPSAALVDPVGPTSGSQRVGRGGSWDYFSNGCRASLRNNGYSPQARYSNLGFRVARNP